MAARTVGRVAYDAFGDAVEWRTYSGDRMPNWDEQDDRLRAAWEAAGEAAGLAYYASAEGDLYGDALADPAPAAEEAPSRKTSRRRSAD